MAASNGHLEVLQLIHEWTLEYEMNFHTDVISNSQHNITFLYTSSNSTINLTNTAFHSSICSNTHADITSRLDIFHWFLSIYPDNQKHLLLGYAHDNHVFPYRFLVAMVQAMRCDQVGILDHLMNSDLLAQIVKHSEEVDLDQHPLQNIKMSMLGYCIEAAVRYRRLELMRMLYYSDSWSVPQSRYAGFVH